MMVAARPHDGASIGVGRSVVCNVRVVPGCGVSACEVLVGEVTQIGDERFRRERLARVVCGAVGLTAAAFRARVEVEHVLPGELVERTGAEVLVCLVLRVHHGLDVEGAQRALRLLILEEDVRNRRDDVQVLAVPEVHEEPEDQCEMRPEKDPVDDDERLAAGSERPEDARQHCGDWPPLAERLGCAFGDACCVVELHADEQDADPREDDDRIATMAAAEACGVDDEAASAAADPGRRRRRRRRGRVRPDDRGDAPDVSCGASRRAAFASAIHWQRATLPRGAPARSG